MISRIIETFFTEFVDESRLYQFIVDMPSNISRIRYVLGWVWFIWKNVWSWDYVCLLKIFARYLEGLEADMKVRGHSSNSNKSLRLTVKLLKRVIDDYYVNLINKRIDERWGEVRYVDDFSRFRLNKHRRKIRTDQDWKDFHVDSRKMHIWAENMNQKYWKIAFRIMEKYMHEWWA